MRSWVLLILAVVNGCGPVLCGREDFKTKDGSWHFSIEDSYANVVTEHPLVAGRRIGLTLDELRNLASGDPRRVPFIFANEGTLTIERGTRLDVITDYDEITKLGANDRVETYDGRLTLEYVRDGNYIKEVYRITKALISASQPDSCAE